MSGLVKEMGLWSQTASVGIPFLLLTERHDLGLAAFLSLCFLLCKVRKITAYLTGYMRTERVNLSEVLNTVPGT